MSAIKALLCFAIGVTIELSWGRGGEGGFNKKKPRFATNMTPFSFS